MFGPIHKAIRCALADLLVRMGSASWSDDAVTARLVADLVEVTALCEDHRAHEERSILPPLKERLQGSLEAIETGHAAQPRLVAELHALGDAVGGAPADRRQIAGRTLYLHFGVFAAELLVHMAEEEQVVQTLLDRLFTEDELRAIHAGLMASLTPEEKARSARWVLRATNREERLAIVSGLARSAPREALVGLLEIARAGMSERDFAELVAAAEMS
jgi:hypothetical protein